MLGGRWWRVRGVRGTEVRGTVGKEGHRAVPCRSEGGGVARWQQEQGDGCWWGAQPEQELSPGLSVVSWLTGCQVGSWWSSGEHRTGGTDGLSSYRWCLNKQCNQTGSRGKRTSVEGV